MSFCVGVQDAKPEDSVSWSEKLVQPLPQPPNTTEPQPKAKEILLHCMECIKAVLCCQQDPSSHSWHTAAGLEGMIPRAWHSSSHSVGLFQTL